MRAARLPPGSRSRTQRDHQRTRIWGGGLDLRRREVRAAPGVGDLLGMVRAPILPAEGSRGEGRGGGGADGRVHREACGGGGGGVSKKEASNP
jgi:hypothetical protein